MSHLTGDADDRWFWKLKGTAGLGPVNRLAPTSRPCELEGGKKNESTIRLSCVNAVMSRREKQRQNAIQSAARIPAGGRNEASGGSKRLESPLSPRWGTQRLAGAGPVKSGKSREKSRSATRDAMEGLP